MAGMPDFGKQIGPLPLGAWIAVVGGSLAYMMYSRSRTSNAPVEVAAGPDAGVGLGGMGAVGAYSPTDGYVSAPAAPVTSVDDNESWGRQAFNWLVGTGADGGVVDTAIRNYLDGRTLNTQQQALITQALTKFGQTPEQLSAAPDPVAPSVTPGFYQAGAALYQVYADSSIDWIGWDEYRAAGSPSLMQISRDSPLWNQLHLVGSGNPFVSGGRGFGYEELNANPANIPKPATAPTVTPTPAPRPAPAPAPAPAPPAPPAARTYVVQPGDSLSRIAARYWEPWITWQSIYNANKGVIGGNPNLIRPGQRLVIA
jgi:hypothetical protein